MDEYDIYIKDGPDILMTLTMVWECHIVQKASLQGAFQKLFLSFFKVWQSNQKLYLLTKYKAQRKCY